MAADPEIKALETAYQALRCIPAREWTRALNYLADRLSADDRTVHISKLLEHPAPTQFVNAGEMAMPYEDAEELVEDNADCMVPVEVNGVAVVSQRFAVMIPISSNGEDVDGHEIEWFDTREAADAFVRFRE